ncbi:bestrophin-1 domain protein [Ancylostoma caninum]|uniref:Bestrophin homolog n=1 Tax=Ancylostoma caninum TaxID=29170 RepID=A0A368GNM6_ANCCA|nr:bestrophin-1 domain protein [Ancylostoma caninum]
MTVSYNLDVSSVSAFSFIKLLFRWRGSIWKSIAAELFLWLCGYYIVLVTYRFVLEGETRRQFEKLAELCDANLKYIPLTFMLGFFVTIVVDRWRNIFQNMGWIENSRIVERQHEAGLALQTINNPLHSVISGQAVSVGPHIAQPVGHTHCFEGFLHENELKELEEIKLIYNKYWAPVQWSMSICMRAYKEGMFETLPAVTTVQSEIKHFRTSLAQLCNYDWVPIPIAYPQVVFLAVRMYFLICIISRQFIISADAHNKSIIDVYVPFMTILQFTFFVGWMKVAEALLNPLGEDDDDFECNFLIDKNIATGMAIVDDTYDVCPQLLPDRFSDPNFHPIYSEDSHKNGTDGALQGSAEGIE